MLSAVPLCYKLNMKQIQTQMKQAKSYQSLSFGIPEHGSTQSHLALAEKSCFKSQVRQETLLQNFKIDKASISGQGRQFSIASQRWQPFLHKVTSPPLPHHSSAIFYHLEQYHHQFLSHLFLYFSPAWPDHQIFTSA